MNKNLINNIVRIVLAILLLVCLADMPYGYYQLVRLVAAVAFAYFAFGAFRTDRQSLGFLFIGLMLLFQPFLKIALGRGLWNIVDVLVALLLVVQSVLFLINKY